MRLPWRLRAPAPGPGEGEASQRLTSVTALLSSRAAGGHQSVPIAEVMELVVPGWTERVAPDPSADPVTGTKWPGPPGSSPPTPPEQELP